MRVLTELTRYFEQEVGAKHPPVSHSSASTSNRTMAGIHAHGLRRDERIYNIFDTRFAAGPAAPGRHHRQERGGRHHALGLRFLRLEGEEQVRRRDVLKIARLGHGATWVMARQGYATLQRGGKLARHAQAGTVAGRIRLRLDHAGSAAGAVAAPRSGASVIQQDVELHRDSGGLHPGKLCGGVPRFAVHAVEFPGLLRHRRRTRRTDRHPPSPT